MFKSSSQRFLAVTTLMALPLLTSGPAAGAAEVTVATPASAKTIPIGTRPESATRGFGGKLYVSVMNKSDGGADGVVKVLDGDTATDFATGMDEPKGLCFTGKLLVVSDVKRVWQIDAKGVASLLADEKDFPQPVSYLNDVSCEPGGKAVYVTDMGANTKIRDAQKKLLPLDSAEAKAVPAIGRIYRIGIDKKVSIAIDARPDMPCPNGVAALGRGRLLVAEFFTGTISRWDGKTLQPLVTGLRGADGLEEDARGNIYVSSWDQGKVWRVARAAASAKAPASDPPVIAEGFQSAADFFLDRKGKQMVLPDMKAGTLSFIPLR
jgi:hypothetical protein